MRKYGKWAISNWMSSCTSSLTILRIKQWVAFVYQNTASLTIIYRDKSRQITTESAVENARSRRNWELSKRVVASRPARLPCLRNTCLTCPSFSPAHSAHSLSLKYCISWALPVFLSSLLLELRLCSSEHLQNLNCSKKIGFRWRN